MSVYEWPQLFDSDADEKDNRFELLALEAREELAPFYRVMRSPLPDNPVELDNVVTEFIDGWLPRVAALAVLAEYYLDEAKARKWPPQITADGEKLTVNDRESRMTTALAPYRLVRDEFDQLVRRATERVRWAQSVRKGHGDAQ